MDKKLEKMKSKRDIKGLISALKNKNYAIRGEAALFLGEIGDSEAIEPLIQILNDEHPGVQGRAAEALGRIGAIQAISPITRVLKEKNPRWEGYMARIGAAKALGNLRDPRGIEPLCEALTDKDNLVRLEVAIALAQLGDDRGFESLFLMFGDDAIGPDAIEALGEIGDARAIQPLIGVLEKGRYTQQEKAIPALIKIGKPAVEPLLASLKTGMGFFRTEIIKVLGGIKDTRAVEPISQIIIEETRPMAPDTPKGSPEAAAKALGNIGDPRAMESLIGALRGGWPRLKMAAAEALANIGGVSAMEALTRSARTEKGYLQDEVKKALAHLKEQPDTH